MKTTIFFTILFCWGFYFFSSTVVTAQEKLVELDYNPVIASYLKANPGAASFRSRPADTLELPFFDDFSNSSVYPDSSHWLDRCAYINSTYADNPLSVGVATMDVLNDMGRIYSNASDKAFSADTLTTRPLNLYYPGDTTIYLSFAYQPQGMGLSPEKGDSLFLQFYSPDTIWHTVWKIQGSANQEFKLVMISIKDTLYLKKGFQFRFRNYASINNSQPGQASNNDHWNVDYVYLDKNRNAGDTVFYDVAFIYPLKSLLKNYSSMPWNHFIEGKNSEVGSSISVPVIYKNNYNDVLKPHRYFQITNPSYPDGNLIKDGGSDNINAFDTDTLTYSIPDYKFPSMTNDSALFKITSYLQTDDDDYKPNDTISIYQKFMNYYAYDDGSAEAGYGLDGSQGNPNALLAYKFYAYKLANNPPVPDTLRAIQIFFNHTQNDYTHLKYFYLTLWKDNNGVPGDSIVSILGMRPEYEDSLNEFHTYVIDTPLLISGNFYVGWKQTTTDFLNVGFDKNNNVRTKIFYNINGTWKNSAYEGALMIRPVFGRKLKTSGIKKDTRMTVSVYPNPVQDVLYISYQQNGYKEKISVSVYDLFGRCVLTCLGDNTNIDVSGLPVGLYIVQVAAGSDILMRQKMIKTK